jgi:hypothetical protein
MTPEQIEGLLEELDNALCNDPAQNMSAATLASGLDWNHDLCQQAAKAIRALQAAK